MTPVRLPAALPDDLPHVWRGEACAPVSAQVSTGHAALDAQLPGGGWPLDGLVEVLQARPGLHVWQLLLPSLAQLVRAQPGPVVLVDAPQVPFGPALAAQGLPPGRLLWVRAGQPAAGLWATEQALRCADGVAVLAWLPQARADALRRLHLAAQQHRRLLVVFRTPAAQHESSPARLRLLLQGTDTLQLRILKRRGPPLDEPLVLPAHPARLAALLATRRGGMARPPATPSRAGAPASREAGHALDRAVAT
ncbi:MAG: translesion DNA synthesis-associated protein ImuA [Ramlibacter sp.]|nr:translesion DNA synthesis-associated protein ImuA [Ramlibacter sp.]